MFKTIYNILLKTYSNQKWWPVTTSNKRFEIILGAVLTQNTSWKNVEKAVSNLRKKGLISPEKILGISKARLAQLIKPSGYYNQKAERLKLVSKFFIENKNPSREQLLNVKGIGNETADSILLYAYNKPFFVVDLYTKRIFSRLGLIKTDDYSEIQDLFHKNLKKDVRLFNEYHALIVRHAKEYCKKIPVCQGCPLAKLCTNFK